MINLHDSEMEGKVTKMGKFEGFFAQNPSLYYKNMQENDIISVAIVKFNRKMVINLCLVDIHLLQNASVTKQ